MSDESHFLTAQSSFSEPTFLDNCMMQTPRTQEMFDGMSDYHPSSFSNSPSFSEITHAFSDRSSTPVSVKDTRDTEDDMSVGSCSNLSNMKLGSESSFFTESHEDGSLARKAMSYCFRLLKQSELSK